MSSLSWRVQCSRHALQTIKQQAACLKDFGLVHAGSSLAHAAGPLLLSC